MALAQVVEESGVLTVTQTSEAASRDLGTVLFRALLSAASLIFSVLTYAIDMGQISFLCFVSALAFGCQLIQSINRLCSRETFVFDRNVNAFIRNGYTVGRLEDVKRIKVQVTKGDAQNPKFRLALDALGYQTVTVVETHSFYRDGEFTLSRSVFSDPNKRFASYVPWLECDEQNLIPFVPPEIEELRRKISVFVAESTPVNVA